MWRAQRTKLDWSHLRLFLGKFAKHFPNDESKAFHNQIDPTEMRAKVFFGWCDSKHLVLLQNLLGINDDKAFQVLSTEIFTSTSNFCTKNVFTLLYYKFLIQLIKTDSFTYGKTLKTKQGLFSNNQQNNTITLNFDPTTYFLNTSMCNLNSIVALHASHIWTRFLNCLGKRLKPVHIGVIELFRIWDLFRFSHPNFKAPCSMLLHSELRN